MSRNRGFSELVPKQSLADGEPGDEGLFGGRVRFDAMAIPPTMKGVTLAPRAPAAAPAFLASASLPMPAPSPLKKLLLPLSAFAVVMFAVAIYLARGDSSAAASAAPTTATVVHAPKVVTPTPAVAPATESAKAPTVEPIDQPVAVAPAAPPPEPKVTAVASAVEAPAAQPPATAPAPEPAAAKRSSKRDRTKGTLRISSSQPREVWIDGRNTKKMTPERLKLSPGSHRVTLLDKGSKAVTTISVEITANTTTVVKK